MAGLWHSRKGRRKHLGAGAEGCYRVQGMWARVTRARVGPKQGHNAIGLRMLQSFTDVAGHLLLARRRGAFATRAA